jgi:hypothetical protein
MQLNLVRTLIPISSRSIFIGLPSHLWPGLPNGLCSLHLFRLKFRSSFGFSDQDHVLLPHLPQIRQYSVWLRARRSDDRAIEVRSPTEAEDFSSSPCVQTGSEAHPAFYAMGTGGKARPRRDADQSPPSSAEVKYE